jgi:hypothetical protein
MKLNCIAGQRLIIIALNPVITVVIIIVVVASINAIVIITISRHIYCPSCFPTHNAGTCAKLLISIVVRTVKLEGV